MGGLAGPRIPDGSRPESAGRHDGQTFRSLGDRDAPLGHREGHVPVRAGDAKDRAERRESIPAGRDLERVPGLWRALLDMQLDLSDFEVDGRGGGGRECTGRPAPR